MCENLTCSAKVGDGGLLEPWGNTRASTVSPNLLEEEGKSEQENHEGTDESDMDL